MNDEGIFSGSCKGDSGGPLTAEDIDGRQTLIGIVSGKILILWLFFHLFLSLCCRIGCCLWEGNQKNFYEPKTLCVSYNYKHKYDIIFIFNWVFFPEVCNIFGVNLIFDYMSGHFHLIFAWNFLCYNYRHGENTFWYYVHMEAWVPEVTGGVKLANLLFTPPNFSN